MRIRTIGALLASLALATVVVGSASAVGGRPFVIELTGANEVPGPGDPDGTGTAWLSVNPGTGSVCWQIECIGTTSRPPRLLGTGWCQTMVLPVGRPQSQHGTTSTAASSSRCRCE